MAQGCPARKDAVSGDARWEEVAADWGLGLVPLRHRPQPHQGESQSHKALAVRLDRL